MSCPRCHGDRRTERARHIMANPSGSNLDRSIYLDSRAKKLVVTVADPQAAAAAARRVVAEEGRASDDAHLDGLDYAVDLEHGDDPHRDNLVRRFRPELHSVGEREKRGDEVYQEIEEPREGHAHADAAVRAPNHALRMLLGLRRSGDGAKVVQLGRVGLL
jgi:hypothetical protein